MTFIFTALAILAVIFAWRYYQQTVLGWQRDSLFDLRDQLRADFLRAGLDLEHPVYQALRATICAKIDFLHRASLLSLFLWSHSLRRSPELLAHLEQREDLRFATDDPRLKDLVKTYRDCANRHIMAYIGLTNVLVLGILLPLTGAYLLHGFWRHSLRAMTPFLEWITLQCSSLASRFVDQNQVDSISGWATPRSVGHHAA